MKTSTLFLGLVVIPLLGACASAPHLNIIQEADTVAILSPADAERDHTLKIHNQAVGEGAKKGAATGAVTGAAYGLACGPFFFICSPFFAVTGAAVGAGTGAVVGAGQGLDAERARQANLKISQYLEEHNPQDDLLAMVVARANNRWQVTPAPADRELIVQFDALGLRTKKNGPVVLVLQATVIVGYADRNGKPQTRTQRFEYEGSPTYIDSWTDEGEEFLRLRFSDAYQTLAENIVVALSVKS